MSAYSAARLAFTLILLLVIFVSCRPNSLLPPSHQTLNSLTSVNFSFVLLIFGAAQTARPYVAVLSIVDVLKSVDFITARAEALYSMFADNMLL